MGLPLCIEEHKRQYFALHVYFCDGCVLLVITHLFITKEEERIGLHYIINNNNKPRTMWYYGIFVLQISWNYAFIL